MSKDYDPRMHTAEHVLNQAMIRTYGCGRSYSMHLEKNKTCVDYHFPHPLADSDAVALEKAVNAQLDASLPVTETSLSVAEAATRLDVSKLPPAVTADPETRIRIVSVGDYDICPCIGAHVSNTAQVGHVQIISHDFTPEQKPDQTPDNGAASLSTPGQYGRLRIRFKLVADC